MSQVVYYGYISFLKQLFLFLDLIIVSFFHLLFSMVFYGVVQCMVCAFIHGSPVCTCDEYFLNYLTNFQYNFQLSEMNRYSVSSIFFFLEPSVFLL